MKLARSALRGAVLLLAACAFVMAPNASATFWWYGENNGTCWQTGTPQSPASACDFVSSGFLQNHTNDVTTGGAANEAVNLSPGDYCGHFKMNVPFDQNVATNLGVYTGFTPPTPYSSYQRGTTGNSGCQALGTHWGFSLRGGQNQNCTGQFAACGMHHYVSLASSGAANRPWSTSSFGPYPSLGIRVTNDVKTMSVQSGAYHYVCPILRDGTSNRLVEYCVDLWERGGGFPGVGFENKSVCADFGGFFFDSVHSAPGWTKAYTTARAGSSVAYAASDGVDTPPRFYWVNISRSDLVRALNAMNRDCGVGYSTNPDNYSVRGVEDGIDGGGITAIGDNSDHLELFTTTDTAYDDERLNADQQLVSNNGQYRLIMQLDGNLVVYKNGNTPIWSSRTDGHPGAYAIMQLDGNLVIYQNGVHIWASGPLSPNQEHMLVMQDDGNLVVYGDRTPRWSLW